MRAKEILFALAQQKKLAHAYILSGNDDLQKKETLEGVMDLLGVARADQMHMRSSEDEITISQIRELTYFFSMSAWNSPYKIAVIENAHLMNREAQSAFLKLLEEPKGNTVFFLLSQYPGQLFDTIRSRAQEVKFYQFAPIASEKGEYSFVKLRSMSVQERFAAAKKIADTPAKLTSTLQQFIFEVREKLLEAARNDREEAVSYAHVARVIEETGFAVQHTNVNTRLALERMMLSFA